MAPCCPGLVPVASSLSLGRRASKACSHLVTLTVLWQQRPTWARYHSHNNHFKQMELPGWCILQPHFLSIVPLRAPRGRTSLFSQGIKQPYRQCIWHFYRDIRSRKTYEEWKCQGNGPKIGKLLSSRACVCETTVRLIAALFSWSPLHRGKVVLKEEWFHTWMSTISRPLWHRQVLQLPSFASNSPQTPLCGNWDCQARHRSSERVFM